MKLSSDNLNFPLISRDTGGKQYLIINGDREIFDMNSINLPTDIPNWLDINIVKIKKEEITDQIISSNKYEQSRLCPVAQLELFVKAGAPLGKFNKLLIFEYSDKNGVVRELNLNCVGEIVPEVSALPSKIVMTDNQEMSWQEVLIRSIDEPFIIKSIESENLECSFSKNEKSIFQTYIKIKRKNNNTKVEKDNITIYFEHPSIKKLDIPVRFLR